MGKYCFLDTFSLKTAFIGVFQAKIMFPGGLLYASCGSPIWVQWYYLKTISEFEANGGLKSNIRWVNSVSLIVFH